MIGSVRRRSETPGWRECRKRRSSSGLRREAPILVGKQAARLAQPRTVERVAHTARVGEVRLADASGQVLFKGLARAGSETVAVLLEELIGDAQQLRGA